MRGTILSLFWVFVSFAFIEAGNPETKINGAELLLTFVIHRHGDRTPIFNDIVLSLSDDSERDIKLSFPFGDSGLTNGGKVRGYQIGQYLRERYDDLLSDIYFRDEIFLRSTDIERTKMTMLSALVAMYPPVKVQRWSNKLNWQPIPYTTVPQEDDFLAFFESCDKLRTIFTNPSSAMFQVPEVNENFPELLELLTYNLPFNFTENAGMAAMYKDLLDSQGAIGVSPPAWIFPYMDELQVAASMTIRNLYSEEGTRRVFGGVFLNEFFKTADAIIAGEEVKQRVRIYSAHDMNVSAQLAAGRLPIVAPKYGSVLSFELYRHNRSGKYFVVPVFLPQAGTTTERILPIEDCEFPCEYDTYKEVTSSTTITEEEYHQECQI